MTTECLEKMDKAIRSETWIELARAGKFEEAVVEYVRAYDYVTFAELCRKFEPFMETRGGFSIQSDMVPNLFFWYGLSDDFSEIMLCLLHEKRLYYHPAQWLTYLADGAVLTIPLVQRKPGKQGFKKPHWLPVCLRVIPFCKKRSR